MTRTHVSHLCLLLLAFAGLTGMRASAQSLDTIPELIANGEADHAIQYLKNRISTNAQDAPAHNLLCRVYFSEEHWDQAISECEQSVKLSSGTSEYHLWLGRAYGLKAEHVIFVTAIGLAKKVHREFQAAVDLAPNSIDAHSDLGEYFVEAPSFLGGGLDHAREQANALEPLDAPAAHWLRGRIAEKDSKSDEAEKEYRAAIASSKDAPIRWVDLASFYRHQKKYDAMQDALTKAVGLDQQKSVTYVEAASQYETTGRNRQTAIRLLREYLGSSHKTELQPALHARMLLGKLLEKTGDRGGAAEQYRIALATASDFAPARDAIDGMD